MYLIIGRVIEVVLKIRVGWSNNIEGLKSLLRFLSREINLEKVELSRFNIELKS